LFRLALEEKGSNSLGSAITNDQEVDLLSVPNTLFSIIRLKGTICFQETLSGPVFNESLFNSYKSYCTSSQSNLVYYAVNLYQN
jgi:hypothetical protein